MENLELINNRVVNSGLVTIDLEDFYDNSPKIIYDIKQNLYQGLLLKEKEFRSFIKMHDWTIYKDKNVAIICSTNAIVPVWAYMLLITKLQSVAKFVLLGSLEELEKELFKQALSKIDYSVYNDAKVVIKGCSKISIPDFVFTEITKLLLPYVSSLMYGEPCSTVPLYKRK